MATIAAKAERRAKVNARLVSLTSDLAQAFGIEIPPKARTTRDQELDQILELERIADIFDRFLSFNDKTEGDADQEGSEQTEPPVDVPNDKPLVSEEGEVVPIEFDFATMKRAELDEVALLFGIEPGDYAKVDDLRAALASAGSVPEETEG